MDRVVELVVAGSANIDLFFRVERFPRPGETLRADSFATFCGGKGANQAVAAGRLEGGVAFVGRVGADGFGREIRASLEAAGVNTEALVEDDRSPTGTAGILVDRNGENQIVISAGANGRVTGSEVVAALERFGRARTLLLQLEIPLEAVRGALQAARVAGVSTILNPAPATELADEILRCVDVLTPNQTELALLAREDDPVLGGRRLIAAGVGCVIMTRGREGALFVDAERVEETPSIEVEAVDTVGAGDAFNGALALFLARGLGRERAVALACRAGALAATKPGAQAAMPSLDELRAVSAGLLDG